MWCKSVESMEESSGGVWRQEVYGHQDSVQVIHADNSMVGICDGFYQIGKSVLQLSLCGCVSWPSHHVGASLL